jgi:amino-acid N-acetyltransferase
VAARADSRRGVEIRDARAADTDAIRALLRRCRLPEDGVPEDAALLVVAERDGELAGVTGLELHGADALLRSVAVSPERRGERIASRLCAEAEQRAPALGARRVFLLTETAERFFARRGYRRLERARAPAGIAATREFAALCPDSAVLMFRGL